MPPRIGILEVGRPPEELQEKHPSYAQMLANWLDGVSVEIRVYPIMDGCTFPDVHDAELWAITGSRCGVYEDHPWIPPLSRFIVEASKSNCKILGVCFGHQIIAQSMGGEVIKSEKGWGAGLHHYTTANWPRAFGEDPSNIALNVFHQDQVVAKPQVSSLLAYSEFCPNAALHYPGFGVSFQGHPEFSKVFEKDLIRLRQQNGIIPKGVAEAALSSLSGNDTRHELARWFSEHWNKL